MSIVSQILAWNVFPAVVEPPIANRMTGFILIPTTRDERQNYDEPVNHTLG